MNIILFGSAYLLDLLIGDPSGAPHPVRLIGRLIDLLSKASLKLISNKILLRLAGLIAAVLVIGISYLMVWGLIYVSMSVHVILGYLVWVYFAYSTLATKSLYKETWRVALALREGDIERARSLTSMVVGRDTAALTETEIYKALIETLAENISDGVIAPLLYLALGGPALAMAFKATNTLDSMVGYRNEKYLYFGWASARLDDLANLVPARITAVTIVFAALMLRLDYKASFQTWMRQGGEHLSPNAGHPEAAMAGALKIQLGGPSVYNGRLVEKPFLGSEDEKITEYHLVKAEQILYVSSGIIFIILLLILGLL